MKKNMHIIYLGLVTLNLQLLTHNSFSQNVGINSDGSNADSNTMLDIKSSGTTSSTFGLKVKDSNGSEKVVVRSDGNVGVGTSNPAQRLHTIDTVRLGFSASDDFGTDLSYSESGGFGTYNQRMTRWGAYYDWEVGSNTGIKRMARLTGSPWNSTGGRLMLYDIDGTSVGTLINSNGLSYFYGGDLALANDKRLKWKDSLGALRDVLYMNTSNNTVLTARTNNHVTISTQSLERLRVTSAGDVGIGTTSPSEKLEVCGNVKVIGTINASGVINASQAITCSSDLRYKKNITSLKGTLSKVKNLKGVSYDWKKREFPEKHFNSAEQIGVIAQDVEKIYPQLVHTDKDGYKSVDYAKFAPILIEAIKEQQQIIEKLNSNVAGLSSENQTLKTENGEQKKEIKTINHRLELIEEYLKTVDK